MRGASVYDLLTPELAMGGLLLLSRLLPLCLLAPFLNVRRAPWFVLLLASSGLAVALFVSAWPLSLASEVNVALRSAGGEGAGLAAWSLVGLAALSELVRGSVFALGVALPLHAMAWTGKLCDALRQAQLLEGDDDSTLGVLFEASALAAFFASGTHLLVVEHFADGLRAAPLGTPVVALAAHESLARVVTLFGDALELSITLAAPVLLCVLFAALCVGLVARVHGVLAAGLREGGLVPWLGLAVVAFSCERLLADAPLLVRVFMSDAERILSSLR